MTEARPPDGHDGFDILAALAVRCGVSVDALITDLSGPTALAKVTREILGLQVLAPAGRGRQADEESNWHMFTRVRVFRESGQSLDEAINSYLLTLGDDDPDGVRHESTKRQYNRLKKKWPDKPLELADLFVGPPTGT
ncbi:MAG: hypothetical protein JNK47_11085 [Mesorhizobium sp.]|nr:hypothetical protein [Mesorhizobium sp.]MBL8577763.1 hypothetical protein [Mesorhizobium sp.]